MSEEANIKQKQTVLINEIGILGKIALAATVILACTLSVYAGLLLCICMLPAITACFLDKQPGKYASRTIGAFNYTGTLPFLFDIWNSNDPSHSAKEMVTNPVAWFTAFAAAGFGWFVIWIMPQVISNIFNTRTELKIIHLKSERKKLVDEWGNEIMKYVSM